MNRSDLAAHFESLEFPWSRRSPSGTQDSNARSALPRPKHAHSLGEAFQPTDRSTVATVIVTLRASKVK